MVYYANLPAGAIFLTSSLKSELLTRFNDTLKKFKWTENVIYRIVECIIPFISRIGFPNKIINGTYNYNLPFL